MFSCSTGGKVSQSSLDLDTEGGTTRQCVQIFAEDSGNTAAGVYDYSFGNGNELGATANQNWGVISLFDGEIVAYGITLDDPAINTQTVAITIDEVQVSTLTIPQGQSEVLDNNLSIAVTAGQVINWQTVVGTENDVVPTLLLCYDIP